MRKLCIALCGGIVLSGCSSFSERHQASGNFKYLDQAPSHQYELPQGLTPLVSDKKFMIPEVSEQANKNLVGAKLDIRAPSLVMPVAPNSLNSRDSKQVEVVFESFLTQQAFRDELWNKVSQFVTQQGYGAAMTREGQQLTTRLIESDPYFKLIFGLEEEYQLTQQYQFKLTVDAQGHRAKVAVALVKHDEQGVEVELNQFAQRRYETRMMNKFLSHVYMQHNKNILDKRLQANVGVVTEMTFDENNNSVYKVNSPFELVWERLATALPKLGLVVDDRDKTANTYYTHFEGVDSGFWSSLFSSDESDIAPLKLEDDQKYQIVLKPSGSASLLSIIDGKGVLLSQQQITAMYPAFRSVLSKKDL